MRKAFQRRCMACNTTRGKDEFIRIVRTSEGKILVDENGKIDGRGAYICKNIKCLEKAIKTKRVSKILKKDIDNKIYENIRGVIIGNEIHEQKSKNQ